MRYVQTRLSSQQRSILVVRRGFVKTVAPLLDPVFGADALTFWEITLSRRETTISLDEKTFLFSENQSLPKRRLMRRYQRGLRRPYHSMISLSFICTCYDLFSCSVLYSCLSFICTCYDLYSCSASNEG